MKIAYVMMDGLEQFVLTPETETEKKLVSVLADSRDRDVSVHRGDFYQTRGGYRTFNAIYGSSREENSAIICLRPTKPAPLLTSPEAAE